MENKEKLQKGSSKLSPHEGALVRVGAKTVPMCTLHNDVKFHLHGKPYLVCDVSGSMSCPVQGKRAIDHLRDAVRNFAGIPILSFSDDVYEGRIPDPQLGTCMDIAFNHLLKRRTLFDYIICISDGAPNDEEAAIITAKALNCPVNIVYIGYPGSHGEAFMDRLARETGGVQVTADMSNLAKSLTAGIKGFLGPATEEKGPINLGPTEEKL